MVAIRIISPTEPISLLTTECVPSEVDIESGAWRPSALTEPDITKPNRNSYALVIHSVVTYGSGRGYPR